MFYPAMASVHAEARYDNLLQEAEVERQLRKGRPAQRLHTPALQFLLALFLRAH